MNPHAAGCCYFFLFVSPVDLLLVKMSTHPRMRLNITPWHFVNA